MLASNEQILFTLNWFKNRHNKIEDGNAYHLYKNLEIKYFNKIEDGNAYHLYKNFEIKYLK